MIDRIDLAPGYTISRLINGLWQLATDHQRRAVDRETAVRDLSRLVEAGLTTFDCADIYLGVEELLGELLQAYRVAGGRLADIQIHTKFVPDRSHLATITRQDVERSIDRSLGRLGVERLDLVQFHWWDYEMPRYIEAAGWLADLQQAGKIRLLGTTNFDVPRMRELLDAGFELVAHQAQYSLLVWSSFAASTASGCFATGRSPAVFSPSDTSVVASRWLRWPTARSPSTS